MLERIIEIIKEEIETEDLVITGETRIVEDLGADSLDKIEIMTAIQEEFKVEFDEKEIKKISKVKDILSYIENNKK